MREIWRAPPPTLWNRKPFDLLVNNAGIMALPKRTMNSQGLELQIATNYFGPFLLTALLFPLMKEEEGSRIVTVSSTVARSARLEFDNLQSERRMFRTMGHTPNQNWLISSSLLSCIGA